MMTRRKESEHRDTFVEEHMEEKEERKEEGVLMMVIAHRISLFSLPGMEFGNPIYKHDHHDHHSQIDWDNLE